MNTNKLFAAALIAAAAVGGTSAAFAADHDFPVVAEAPASSGLTRAQVHAEVLQARQDGTLELRDESDYPVIAAVGTPKTRDEVKAELAQAKRDGTLELRNDNSYPEISAAHQDGTVVNRS